MFAYIQANIGTIVVAAVVFGFAGLILIRQIRKSKNSSGSCACGCSPGDCTNASICMQKEE